MSVRPIIHDQLFLQQKSVLANKKDLAVALDLRDTLIANKNKALGLAANMIGEDKRIIALFIGPLAFTMINPKIISKKDPYYIEEGCLSLKGERRTIRYKEILVEYEDMNFKKQRQTYKGEVSEVIQHEVDHCEGKII